MQAQIKLTEQGIDFKKFAKSLNDLTKKDVLVGVPESTAPRKKDSTPKMNNATLAYIHDNGSPAAHIPPRPFLRPGIDNAKKEIGDYLGQAGRAVLDRKLDTAMKALNAAGLSAQKSIRRKIQTGPFTPLKAATIAARKRKHPSRSNTSVTPLIDTGQMQASINYIIREK